MKRPLACCLLALFATALFSPPSMAAPMHDDSSASGGAKAAPGGQRGWLRERLRQRQQGPLALPAGAISQAGIAYGPAPEQRLDLYRPADAHDAPAILMVHGGGWARGDKAATGVVQNKIDYWLPKGYVFVSVDYRVVPDANPLQQADDIAMALAYAQQHAAEWGADPARFVLMGHSAGAHLVSLLSAAPDIARRHGAKPWLGTVALDSAAYDVTTIMQVRHFPLYDRAFGDDRQLWRDASPTLRLTQAPVPMLLVCSSRREDSCRQARGFAARAGELGGKVDVVPIDLRHGVINQQLGEPGELTRAVEDFLHSLRLP